MRVKDLPEAPPIGAYLYCKHCGGQQSAYRADYLLLNTPQLELRCCGRLLLLVQEEIVRKVVAS